MHKEKTGHASGLLSFQRKSRLAAFSFGDGVREIGAKVEVMELVVIWQDHLVFGGLVKSGMQGACGKVQDVAPMFPVF